MALYHAMTLALLGLVFGLSLGSFFLYHIYLTSTNQTTLENLSPYLLLRLLPPPAPSMPSNPPPYTSEPQEMLDLTSLAPITAESTAPRFTEHELTRLQRRKVHRAHRKIRVYDRGWRNNWMDIVGAGLFPAKTSTENEDSWQYMTRALIPFLIFGGRGRGDGRSFPHHIHAEVQLTRLATELAAVDDSN
jgi:palmitoyltransferase